MDILTEEQRAVLVRYFQEVQLSADQRDRLAAKYWEASKPVRKDIALIYCKLFTDADFVNRLLAQHDQSRVGVPAEVAGGFPHSGASSSTGASLGGAEVPVSGQAESESTGSPNSASGAAPTHHTSFTSPPPVRRTHTQMLLRTAIQDRFPKLTGDGPYTLSFTVVESEEQRKRIIDLYASQFEHPDPVEMQKLVTLPLCSTRTRRRTSGSYTWYIHCRETADAVCAVTVTSHHYNSHRFVEMPLFATAGGYKKNGFGRLLNAALRAWCSTADIEFIMISADRKAIPFWRHLGYEIMSRQEKNGIAFYYDHECYTFAEAEPMICYCDSRSRKRPRGISSSPIVRETEVDRVLKLMPRFVMAGEAELPTP